MIKAIIQMNKTIEKICGFQTPKENVVYRKSGFVICSENEKGIKAFSTLTGELIHMDSEEDAELQQEYLIRHRFLVPESFDEQAYVLKTRQIMRDVFMNDYLNNFTILTTTDCNARCFYCYEKDRKKRVMTADTAKAVADYILHVSKGRKIGIKWFGGEPLCNMPAISIICKELRSHGAQFDSSMISNGFLMGAAVAAEASEEWNLKKIQITLDGTANVYREIKSYVNGGDDPYNRVLRNVDACLANGINVLLRLNVGPSNYSDMLKLCDELIERYQDRKGIAVYVALLRDFEKDNANNVEIRDCMTVMETIMNKLNHHGMYSGNLPIGIRVNECMADADNSAVILPNGQLGKCEHFSDSEFYGSIFEHKHDMEAIESWKETVPDLEMCANCPLYPICIRLKKCDWTKFGCTEEERDFRIKVIRNKMNSIPVK